MKRINLHRSYPNKIKWINQDEAELTIIAHRTADYKRGEEQTEVTLHVENWQMCQFAKLFWEKFNTDKKRFDTTHQSDVDSMRGE